ncbi:DUF3592 domain-containing protein [Candidatus Nanohalovita haloferacivicina]|uniref:DUF3592 domain-containing protein n=1 Tax=Candidatus Nanohalovita haloferacivicina TaxID=2978046 RepID=UPI00325FCAB0|nr:Uncharacterized membrane protein, DUF3592 family [Candidatus Nanohalobia archaeon BNXNv]
MEAFDFSGHELVIGVIVVGAALAGYGGFFMMHQDDISTSGDDVEYETVNATISSTDLASISTGNGTVYRPEASFTYTFNGSQYSSNNVFPTERRFQYPADAEDQIDDFSEGDQITAYIQKDSPGEAFLRKPE